MSAGTAYTRARGGSKTLKLEAGAVHLIPSPSRFCRWASGECACTARAPGVSLADMVKRVARLTVKEKMAKPISVIRRQELRPMRKSAIPAAPKSICESYSIDVTHKIIPDAGSLRCKQDTRGGRAHTSHCPAAVNQGFLAPSTCLVNYMVRPQTGTVTSRL